MNLLVDLNADLGEGAGHDEELLSIVTSASIASGAHAGDPVTIAKSLVFAREAGVSVGAHPGFWDRENFGRRNLATSADEVFALLVYQISAFNALAHAAGVHPNHVKPHGALYNMAVGDATLSDAVARAIAAVDSSLILFAPAESELSRAGRTRGLQIASEVFADRNYLADGSLVPRTRPNALLHGPTEAAERVVRMLREGLVRSIEGGDVAIQAETVCVHGDNPDAVAFARAVRDHLVQAGVKLAPPLKV